MGTSPLLIYRVTLSRKKFQFAHAYRTKLMILFCKLFEKLRIHSNQATQPVYRRSHTFRLEWPRCMSFSK